MVHIDASSATALVAYQGSASQVVQDIMKRVVADTSGNKYRNKKNTLLLWLYVNDSLRT